MLYFQDVGLTNMKIITGLSLKNGEMYFVTVKGESKVLNTCHIG